MYKMSNWIPLIHKSLEPFKECNWHSIHKTNDVIMITLVGTIVLLYYYFGTVISELGMITMYNAVVILYSIFMSNPY